MARRSSLGALIALMCACGGASDPRAVRLDTVAPSEVPNSEPARVSLVGGGFLIRSTQTLGKAPGVEVASAHRVFVGETELGEVTWLSEGELSAVVPAGLPAGTYPVRIETPFGRTAVRDPGLTIREPSGPVLSSAGWSQPGAVAVGREFVVGFTIHNAGDAAVSSATLSVTNAGGGGVAIRSPLQTLDIPAHGSGTFLIPLRATAAGSLRLEVVVFGTSARDGAAVQSGAFFGPDAAIYAEVFEVAADATRDGAPFATLTAHANRLYVGPNRTGTGAARMHPDGLLLEPVQFDLSGDTCSCSPAPRNASGPVYPSIGAPGCTPDTASCGPDNEQSRGFLMAGALGTMNHFSALGSRTDGGTRLFHDATSTGTTLDFTTYDLTTVFADAPATRGGYSAYHHFNDRMFVGVASTAGTGPLLVALWAYGWLNLAGPALPDVGADVTGPALIDSITDFNGLVYVANRGGCARSSTSTPNPATNLNEWRSCTPSHPAWAGKPGRTVARTYDFEPADKAVPYLAAFGGRLYLARNTASGPQLWSCIPGGGTSNAACDPAEWTPIALNGTGDLQLSQFDDPANTAISLLAATATHLYLGFDNPNGVAIYRSRTTTPSLRADFEGLGGCSAALGPGGCPGRGTPGVGLPTMTRIFDARPLDLGGRRSVFFTAGDGVSPARVFRLD